MTPQLVDLDQDGFGDLVMGTYEGVAWVVRGSEGGYQSPERIMDSKDRAVLVSFYWDNEAEDFATVDRSPEHEEHPTDHGTSAASVDWDGDGDMDLILGSYEGHLYLRRNEGTATEPRFAAANERILANGSALSVPGGMTAAKPVDWNGDGLFDLVCGGVQGGVYYFENEGTKAKPKFKMANLLLKPMPSMGEDEEYPSVVVPEKDGEPMAPGTSYHVEVVDYNQDGKLDLLIGGNSSWFSKPPRTLNEKEKERKAELVAQMAKLEQKMDQLYADVESEEDYEKLANDPAASKLQKQWEKLMEELEPFSSYPDQEASYIWLYLRK